MKIRLVKTPVKHSNVLAGCFLAAIACCLLTFVVIISAGKIKSTMVSDNTDIGNKITVVIDPGHGGIDGGAVGYGGVVEKNINLAISLKLKSLFNASGLKTIMTRIDDRSIHDQGSNTVREKKVTDIHNRSKLFAKYPNAILISIHQNKFEQSKYSGTQVFYSKNNDNSKLLAQFIQSKVKDMIQPSNERVIKPAGKNLYILYHASSPAVMVECGFLSNQHEAELLQQSSYQTKIAFAIYCGTLNYYSNSAKRSTSSASAKDKKKSNTPISDENKIQS